MGWKVLGSNRFGLIDHTAPEKCEYCGVEIAGYHKSGCERTYVCTVCGHLKVDHSPQEPCVKESPKEREQKNCMVPGCPWNQDTRKKLELEIAPPAPPKYDWMKERDKHNAKIDQLISLHNSRISELERSHTNLQQKLFDKCRELHDPKKYSDWRKDPIVNDCIEKANKKITENWKKKSEETRKEREEIKKLLLEKENWIPKQVIEMQKKMPGIIPGQAQRQPKTMSPDPDIEKNEIDLIPGGISPPFFKDPLQQIKGGTDKTGEDTKQEKELEPKIEFGKSADPSNISEKFIELIKDLLRVSGNPKALITINTRTPEVLAQKMYTYIQEEGLSVLRLRNKSLENTLRIYDVYETCFHIDQKSDNIIAAMAKEIVEIGPMKVSPYCRDSKNEEVVGIPTGTLKDPDTFLRALKEAKKKGSIINYVEPNGSPIIRIEIRWK